MTHAAWIYTKVESGRLQEVSAKNLQFKVTNLPKVRKPFTLTMEVLNDRELKICLESNTFYLSTSETDNSTIATYEEKDGRLHVKFKIDENEHKFELKKKGGRTYIYTHEGKFIPNIWIGK